MLTYLIVITVVVTLFGVNSLFLIPGEIRNFCRLIDEEKYEEALQIYQHTLQGRSHYPEVVYGLAKIYERRKEWYLAVSQYQQLLKGGKFPNNVDEISIRLKRIEANKMIQEYEEVAEDCYAILEINPEHHVANFEVGKRLFALKNYQAARFYFERINNNDNKEILEILLDIEINENNFDKALFYIESFKKIFQENLSVEILYKEILIYFNLKDYLSVINITYKISVDVKIPKTVGIIIGIAFFNTQDYEQSFKYFDTYLKSYVDDRSEYISVGRYLYVNLLVQKGNFYKAMIQNNLIEQVDPDFRDVSQRKEILNEVNNAPVVKEILSITDMEKVVDEIIKFDFPDFFFIDNRLAFNGDESSRMKWCILSISTELNKIYNIFISFNIIPYTKEDIDKILSMIEHKITSNFRSLDFIFLTLSAIGIESEKVLIQKFNSCYFYNQKAFINYFKDRKLPALIH